MHFNPRFNLLFFQLCKVIECQRCRKPILWHIPPESKTPVRAGAIHG